MNGNSLLRRKALKKSGGERMTTERPCTYSKPRSWREKGCSLPAKYRVMLGGGYFMDVCEEHVKGYRGLGLKIIVLKEVPV